MGKPFVVYNAETGQLSNNPAAFADSAHYVASVVWTKEVGDSVRPGEKLAVIQWGNGSREDLHAPGGCSGRVAYLNRGIVFENLEFEPPQNMARIEGDGG